MTVARSWLECSACGHQVPLEAFGGCTTCAADGRTGVLEVGYRAIAEQDASVLLAEPHPGIWRWHGLLPVLEGSRTLVSLGEGQTPLLRADQPLTPTDGPAVWLKYEGKNPTHSFKDRFQSVAITSAAALGVTRIVCQSTGNHGVAAAAYATRAGLQCVVLTHEEVPTAHVEAIRQFGGMPVAVPPPERSRLLRQLVDAGWYPATTHWPFPVSNPYGIEGYKTIAFEIAEQLGAAEAAAAHVFVPVGGGDSIYGIYKGWRELVQLGTLDRLPRLYACQPEHAAPLVAAEAQNATEVPRVETQRSPALSIREAETGGHALRALHDSGGRALAVSDTEIIDAMSRLGRLGLSVDPASAASVAGALAMLESGKLDDGRPIVCILTASGARWPPPQGWQPGGAQLAVLSADQAYKAIVALTD
jgi:threonine synthase